MQTQAVVERLRGAGYRLTPQRLAVIEALVASHSHPTAYEIYTQVQARYPMLGLATVYKTLDMLKSLGEVVETGFGPGGARYEPNLTPHANLVCRKCGRVVDLDLVAPGAATPFPDAAVAARAAGLGFTIQGGHIEYFGECSACRQTEP